MARQPRIAIPLVLMALVAGCTGPAGLQSTSPTPATPSPSPTGILASPSASTAAPSTPVATVPPDLGTHAQMERDGVRVSIDVDAVPLRKDGRATVTLTVENRSNNVVRWLADGCRVPVSATIRFVGDSWIGGIDQTGVAAAFKELALQPLLQNGFAALGAEFDDPMQGQPLQGCSDIGIVEQLKAGAHITRTVTWPDPDPIIPQLPNGPIEIVASFPFHGWPGDPEGQRYEPIAARLPSWLVSDDSIDFLPPGPAIDAALADPQFAAWLLTKPRDQWVNSSRDLDPVAGSWEIGLFVLNGYALVKLDSRTGQVISRRFG
jgi:hypothetical protein